MHIAYDTNSDQVKVELLPNAPVASVREVNGIVLRYGPDRRVVGIEIREGRQRIDWALRAEEGSLHAALVA
ncbi:MAG: DUF2283 domain-containing protein [candidate division NC10 bacterium]|nr:DUF2283 domain-containing protein [candidate division NC10 bacterium]